MRKSLPILLALCACAHAKGNAPSTPPPQAEAIATTPDEPFRGKQPTPLANEPAFTAPVPTERKLKNGAELLVVENHAVPLVAVEVVIRAGVDEEPLNRDGLAEFLAQMLLEGTTSRTAIDIEIARERLAAQLSSAGGTETTVLHLNALKETLPEALALMADVLLHPALRDGDIDRLRGLTLTGLAQKKGSAVALARDDFFKLVWGSKNVRGLPASGTPESVKAITAADLKRFHKAWFVPNNALISVSGDTN